MSALVEIRNLKIRRQQGIVLEVARLDIERGRVTALVGPNGAGKTTLLLALARLLKAESGEIRFDGRPLETIPALEYRRRIGLVMQDALLLGRSVFDNVALGLRFRRLPGPETCRRVDEWLERLGVSSLRNRKATQLSGGEAQRVALARALVLQPALLLMDEPFKSLDEASHSRLLADLKSLLPQTNTTTLFATHSAKDVCALADEKITLQGGKLSE